MAEAPTDQRRFSLDEDECAALEELLDHPIPETAALTTLFKTPAQWEQTDPTLPSRQPESASVRSQVRRPSGRSCLP